MPGLRLGAGRKRSAPGATPCGRVGTRAAAMLPRRPGQDSASNAPGAGKRLDRFGRFIEGTASRRVAVNEAQSAVDQ